MYTQTRQTGRCREACRYKFIALIEWFGPDGSGRGTSRTPPLITDWPSSGPGRLDSGRDTHTQLPDLGSGQPPTDLLPSCTGH
ncbi:hypothetical protein RRG08_052984 [Elysia crispata]|uniref:Uncharacterized protein n=1 Tax=Elysia crispata TaxID=231223 RepID=A0AAE0ZJN2_9GAST|nr:hypothetical protein RRG08_052984 [Elysia crispata]